MDPRDSDLETRPVSSDGEKESAMSRKPSEESLGTQQRAKARAEKAAAIQHACDTGNVEALIAYATSEGGLLDDELRQRAWPIFLQCDANSQLEDLKPLNDLPRHADEDQVQLDVNRAFVYYPNVPEEDLLKKKDQLSDLIVQILRNYPMLCYFQGYHDIVQVLLLVLGSQKAALAMARVSLFRIRDYMLPTLTPALKHLQLIPAIVGTIDPALWRHLANIQPFFALASTLTLYAHDIQEYSDIARLFDFLLAREPIVAIYLFAAIILSRKKELMNIPMDEPEMLHFTLSKLPCPLNLDGLITSAVQLFKDHPPESLPLGAWKQIPSCSVLKTSRDTSRPYNVDEAVQMFHQQARQMRNEERRKQALEFGWKHRRAIGSVALAILVGAASIYIRKKGLDSSIWYYVGRLQSMLKG
ncbi:uncharacterized protein N7496_009756 [Penicillium cataractarum]|uniref:Rab-GAP TBC domain-containing protein n=1 Tax=Penicillium cataractarum TaxID=2100454 RepID=A0A9W9V079_9EURO|nr:uncharacterized protein N7496_009756 [Penicillium cataractarum]KAJ5364043.1 hypothetical protein N7496_009756 [Penicillium cataractarum]